ncbi:MAG: hypothetical protein V1904_05700 [Bacteroidota bacterium]
MNQFKKYFPFIILLVFLILHLPFLTSDPDPETEPDMRGAYTDEGLYTSQIRNLINQGHFGMKENSTFVRGPVFNIVQLPFFFVLGTNLWVSRMVILLLTLITIYVFLRDEKLKLFAVFLVLFSYCEYHIFQFSHYGMAEMVCVNFLLLGIYFLYKCYNDTVQKNKLVKLLIASFFVFLCYASKIQYLYVVVLLPATSFIMSVRESIICRKFSFIHYRLFLSASAFGIFFIVIYYLLWFLPNREFYTYIMTNETNERIPGTIGEIRKVADFNYTHIFWVNNLKIYLIHTYIVIAAVFLFIFFRNKRNSFFVIAVFAMVWIISELHKVPMKYLPYRYLISMLFAGGVFVSASYAGFTEYFPKFKKWLFLIAFGFTVYFMIFNFSSFQRRTWEIKAVNNYFAQYDLSNEKVIGAWAPSCCWQNNALTMPVWYNYFNWKDPVNVYKPAVIITESDEKDADYNYKNQNIDLFQISDSVRQFSIWKYKLNVFWMKNQ